MTFRILSLAVMFGLVTGSTALSQNEIDCTNTVTQMEMTQCAERDWQAADIELNDAYHAAMAEMKTLETYLPDYQQGGPEVLRDAQRAWIPYRDKACEAYGFLARGGTMEPMLVYACLADLTRKRTLELKELAAGLGS